MGCGTVVVPVASGRNLRTVFTASVFDCELELQRLAPLRGCGELGAVAARIEQGSNTLDGTTAAYLIDRRHRRVK